MFIQNSIYAEEYELIQNTITQIKILCDNRNLKLYSIKLQLLAILNSIKMGKITSAYDLMTEVIELIYRQDGIRIVLDAGPEIRSVLDGMDKKPSEESDSIKRKFIDKLLNLSPVEAVDNYSAGEQLTIQQEQTHTLVEPLNRREIEIIKLVAMGESNAEIGSNLFISENTVKWHIKNIFAKLAVTNRTAAVVAAQQYQLIRIK